VVKQEQELELPRFDPSAFDAVIREEEGLSSGKLEWREIALEGGFSCGR
jgi:hypothetical protein